MLVVQAPKSLLCTGVCPLSWFVLSVVDKARSHLASERNGRDRMGCGGFHVE